MAVNGADIVAEAMKYIGLKYVWGGTSLTSGADCSGYLQSVFKKFGINLARVTYDQINQGSKISFSDMQVGDLIFFDTDPSQSGPDHVGLYIGNGKFVHAPKPGDSVKVSSLSDGYYSSRFMAARRPDGMVGGGKDSLSADSAGPGQPKLSPEELAQSYGWAYGFLNSIPEVAKLFQQAVNETWSSDQFKAKLRNTEWWKTNSATQREMQALAQTDPASFNARVSAAQMLIRQKANEMGAILTDGLINSIGEDFVRTGMNDEQLSFTLAKYIDFTNEGTLGGQAGAAQVRLKQLAQQNGVQLTDDAVKNYAQQIAMGASTMEQAETFVRSMAKSMFPAYADQIDAGVNMKQIAQPYMQMASDTLERAPVDMGLDNPLVRQAFNGMNQDGKPTGMTLTDYQTFLRNQPGWFRTSNAREGLTKVGSDVLKSMGLIS